MLDSLPNLVAFGLNGKIAATGPVDDADRFTAFVAKYLSGSIDSPSVQQLSHAKVFIRIECCAGNLNPLKGKHLGLDFDVVRSGIAAIAESAVLPIVDFVCQQHRKGEDLLIDALEKTSV